MLDKSKIGFKNLRRNDGVIMFIVVSVMTIMIIISLAFWVAVSAEMTDIKEDFSVEQTYQAAVSVNEWVYDYLSAYMGIAETIDGIQDDCPLLDKMLEIGGSGGGSMSATDIDGMNEYGDCEIMINVSPYSDVGNKRTMNFEIISTIANGANYESFSRSCALEIEKIKNAVYTGGDEYFEYSLSTTGGSFATSKFEGYAVYDDIYFGNDLIRWKDGIIASDVNVFGTIETSGGFYFSTDTTKPIELNVGKNLIHDNSGAIMPCGGIIRIGGFFKTTKPISGDTTFYILGEERTDGNYAFHKGNEPYSGEQVFYINGDVYINRPTKGCVFFINGDLTIDLDDWSELGTFYVSGNVNNRNHAKGGKVFYTGDYSGLEGSWNDNADTLRNYTHFFEKVMYFPWGGDKAWPEKDDDINVALFPGRDYESVQTARFNLRLATAELEYDENNEILYDENGDPQIAGPKSVPSWDITEELEEMLSGGDAGASQTLNLINNNEIDISTRQEIITITESGYIRTSADDQTKTIIIDTMSNDISKNSPESHKDIYIRLCGVSGTNTFKWRKTEWEPYLNIVIRGAGNVIFFLDDGVKYKSDRYLFIGHEGWLKYFGRENTDNVVSWFGSNKAIVKSKLDKIVHKNVICGESIRSECFYCKDLDPDDYISATSLPGRYVLRQDDAHDEANNKYNLIKKYSSGDDAVFLHNNIFFIDNNSPTGSSFYGKSTIFFGYVYAPYSHTTLPRESGWSLAAGAFILGALDCSGDAQNDFFAKHIMPAEYYPEFSRTTLTNHIGGSPGGGSAVYTEEYVPASLNTTGYR